MILTLEGVQGTGKSLTATALCYIEHIQNRKKIFSNNHLNFPHQYFGPEYFLDHVDDDTLTDCVLMLDEAYLFSDSRSSGAKINKLFTYFFVQTRKRGVDLIVCAHHIDTLDKRLRRAADIRGTCSFREEKPCRGCKGAKVVPVTKGFCLPCQGSGEIDPQDLEENAELMERYKDKYKGNGVVIPCEDCGGSGKGTVCSRCVGNGFTGWAVTTLYNKRKLRSRTITIPGPHFWGLYDTHERIPFMKKQLKIPVEEL